jgi:ribose 5-phosphate isomerase B
MRIALGSDEPYPVHRVIAEELARRGHEVVTMGSVASGRDEPWPRVAEEVARAVAEGRCEEAILLCWTGTGVSMAANKVPGIRAALCADPPTAAGARVWNHANVLCLSNRSLSQDVAKEILAAWFDTDRGDKGAEGVRALGEIEERWRRGRGA